MLRVRRRSRGHALALAAIAFGLWAVPPAQAQVRPPTVSAPIVSAVPMVPVGTFAVVTRNDGSVFSAISETQFDRFFDAALSQQQQEPVSKMVPLVPPRFTACVDASRGGSRRARWRSCAGDYATVRNTAAQQLLSLTWIMAEAERRAIIITDRRVAREIRDIAEFQFDGPRGLRRFMRDSGLNEHDIRLNAVTKLVQDVIVRQIEASSPDDASPEAQAEQQQAIETFRNEFFARSPRVTTCAPYYAKLPACTGKTDA